MIIGKAWQNDRHLEIRLRQTKETVRAKSEALVETIHKLLDKVSSL